MERAEYIGPDACRACHPGEYAAWSASLHRAMNARADAPGAIIGDFDGAVVHYAGGEVRFERGGNTPTMTLARGGLQEYVGIADGSSEEVRLPFGWWPRLGGWFAQPTFDPWLDERAFDPFAPIAEPWAERCPWCHSTYPFALRVARGIGHGLEQRFVDPTAPRGRERLDVAQQVTVGISCESCHLGGLAHAAGAAIRFVPGDERSFDDERRDPDVVNAVCAQCHSGPSPRLPDGTALRNSSEALDLAASPCAARCTDCHDPHGGGADEARALDACTSCHGSPPHARHAAATCLDCHMPRVVQGIDRFVRTHRISSPTDARAYALGAPNACNLCHLDRTIAWTRDALYDGWGVRLAVPDDDDRDAGDAYLASTRPVFRLAAMHAYARRGELVKVVPGLTDPRAHVRAWTSLAIDELAH